MGRNFLFTTNILSIFGGIGNLSLLYRHLPVLQDCVSVSAAMGARQSKRSVDILAATKMNEEVGGVEVGKLERLEEGDVVKATQNGTAPHAEKEASSPVTEVGLRQ